MPTTQLWRKLKLNELLQGGSRYLTRNGLLTSPLQHLSCSFRYPFVACVDGIRLAWTVKGEFHPELCHDYDLVALWLEKETE